MKIVQKLLGVAVLTLIFTISPYQSAGAVNLYSLPTNETDTQIEAFTRVITVKVTFEGARFAPDFYYYDRFGWKGTLWLTKSTISDDKTEATYKGIVSCSSNYCPMSSDLVTQ